MKKRKVFDTKKHRQVENEENKFGGGAKSSAAPSSNFDDAPVGGGGKFRAKPLPKSVKKGAD